MTETNPIAVACLLSLHGRRHLWSGLGRRSMDRHLLHSGTLLGAFSALVPGELAFAGGGMVFITLDELLPMAREHGHQHYTAIGIILGALLVFLLSGIFGV